MERTVLRGELLGRMRVTVDDRPTVAAWPRPAARRLVALLLIADEHALTREMVATRLFEHLEPARAARAVSKALSQARSVLDGAGAAPGSAGPAQPSLLAADRSTIWIAEHVAVLVDVREGLARLRAASGLPTADGGVLRLREALAATAAPVLLDDRYEPWAQDLIAEVERARKDVRLVLARATGTLEDWRAVADDEPTSEEACAALAAGLTQAGHRQEAMRVVARTQAALADLGVAIDPQLLATASPRPTAAQAAAARPAEAGPVATRPAPARPAAGGRGEEAVAGADAAPTGPTGVRWPLIGRERELEAVLRATRPAAAGYGGALLLAAPAGMGKTHLLRHVSVQLAAEGWAIAAAAAVPEDRLAPFASLRTALLAFHDQPIGPLAARILRPERTASPPLRPADLAPFTDALRRHLDRLAVTRPLMLCLDDVQWADVALQRVLARLVAGFGQRRWAVVLAARTDEPDAPVPDLPTSVDRIALRPLTERASRELAAHAAVSVGITSPRTHETIARRGLGHPFFIIELARSLPPGASPDDTDDTDVTDDPLARPSPGDDAAVPERIVALLRRRIGACSPPARRLAAFVAVAGEDASAPVVRHVAARLLGGADLRAVADELERAALVRSHDEGLRLAHPLLRDAATATLDAALRAELHDAVADALVHGSGDDEAGALVLSIARHRLAAFEAADDPSRAAAAVHAGVAGAATSRRLAAPAAAEELHRRALLAWSRVPEDERDAARPAAFAAHVGLGGLCADAGDHQRADESYTAALALASTDDEVARAEQAWAQLPYRQGDLDGSLARLESALELLTADSPAARARLLVEIGWIHYRRRHDAALAVLERAVQLAESTEDWTLRTRALDRYGFALARMDVDLAALPVFDRALLAAERCGDPSERAIVHLHHARPLYRAGRRYEAHTSLARAATLCERHGFHYLRSIGHWVAADFAEAEDDLARALAERDAELELLRMLDNPRHLAGCQTHRAALLRALGRVEEAEAAEREASRAAARLGEPAAASRSAWGQNL